ncbi:MAG: hypothetical protein QF393_02475 [Rhodospirillales bacterium]|jgi:hypothetical protein|nr:hypothetical protein [Rhodospirillales bacterium]MDP6645881.1 hypothetical protein [Rhodospirillales bacterium]|tara:strand:- start:3422 stop:3874 length:453 start_codon:yes stop_codon:yes gene_type:complete
MELDFFVVVALSGILATYLHLVMGPWGGRVGMFPLDFSRVMADLTYGDSFEGQASYWGGQIAVFFNGILLALLYATVVAQYLPGDPAVRGLIYGFILFLGSGLFFIPFILKEGFFLSHADRNAWLPLLFVHLVYGLVLGWLSPILGYTAA